MPFSTPGCSRQPANTYTQLQCYLRHIASKELSMSEIKLTYFNTRGRAEVTRLIFTQAQRKFVDNRIDREEWAKMKDSTPKGQLPVLEVDGMMICESAAIARFAARETGLYGSNNKEAAICDMVTDSIGEVAHAAINKMFSAKTEDEKNAADEKIYESLKPLEKLVAQYKKGTYVLGDKVAAPDISLYSMVAFCTDANPEFKTDSIPTIAGIAKSFSEQPHIAAYLASRPKTEH
ncbi:HPGDS [Bugula neritina]|uniref:HPGDS n=1 Tax=Bugula neritina TaxID=10212 RepID=A0A7J7J4U2_BUGNE|nr:HPGDS [Bugula neritina]